MRKADITGEIRSDDDGGRSTNTPPTHTHSYLPLLFGGLAAILASTCCLGPLVLVAIGFSGAWIGNLTVLEPYRPIFVGVALLALFFAYRRIFRHTQTCKPGEVCAIPLVRATYKIIFWIVTALVVVALMFPYVLPILY